MQHEETNNYKELYTGEALEMRKKMTRNGVHRMWETHSVVIPKQKHKGYIEKRELQGKAVWVTTENIDSRPLKKGENAKVKLKQ